MPGQDHQAIIAFYEERGLPKLEGDTLVGVNPDTGVEWRTNVKDELINGYNHPSIGRTFVSPHFGRTGSIYVFLKKPGTPFQDEDSDLFDVYEGGFSGSIGLGRQSAP